MNNSTRMNRAASYTSSSTTRRTNAMPTNSFTRLSNPGSGASSYGGSFSQLSLSPRGYGFSSSKQAYASGAISSVQFNPNLLATMNVEFDKNIRTICNQEKEDIKILNNRFASFIDKVRFLEQQNKMLETKWSILQQQTTSCSKLDTMYEAYIANLRRQLDELGNEKMRLESEHENLKGITGDFTTKYEDEVNKVADAENTFVVLKKDVDDVSKKNMELEAKYESIQDELSFFRDLYEAELKELLGQIKDSSVVVEMDNSRDLDLDAIVAEVRAQYEDIAKRSKAEAESWYKQKIEDVTNKAGKYQSDLHTTKVEIADLKRMIVRLQKEIEAVEKQKIDLESKTQEMENENEQTIQKANESIEKLQQSLQNSKSTMARQVREYQDLMNIKLALNIEIATYRKLLEGEESRMSNGSIKANVCVQFPSSESTITNEGEAFGQQQTVKQSLTQSV